MVRGLPTRIVGVARFRFAGAEHKEDAMKVRFWIVVKSVTVLALVSIVGVGCSSEQKAETQSASETTSTSQKQTTYGRAVDRATEVAQALSNPKEGLDPVCGMALSEDPVTVMVDDKTYGFCSEHCAEQFEADPDKYLAMASSDGHEGHDH